MNTSKLRVQATKAVHWYPGTPENFFPALRNVAEVAEGLARGMVEDLDDQIEEVGAARGARALATETVRFLSLAAFRAGLRLIASACRFQLATEGAKEALASAAELEAEGAEQIAPPPAPPPAYPMPGEIWEDCDGTKGRFLFMLPGDVCSFWRLEDECRWDVPLAVFREFFCKVGAPAASAATEPPTHAAVTRRINAPTQAELFRDDEPKPGEIWYDKTTDQFGRFQRQDSTVAGYLGRPVRVFEILAERNNRADFLEPSGIFRHVPPENWSNWRRTSIKPLP